MSARGHIPVRRCLGCGARRPQRELVRFTAAPAAGGRRLVRDEGSRRSGRGLYVCPRRECFEDARARSAFTRAARAGGGPLAVAPELGADLGDEARRN